MADVQRGNRASERIITSLAFAFVRAETFPNGRIVDHFELRPAVVNVP